MFASISAPFSSRTLLFSLLLGLGASFASAAGVEAVGGQAGAPVSPWKGSAEFGLSSATGNTSARSMNGQLKLSYQLDEWKHTFRASTVQSRENGKSTVNRSAAEMNSRYSINDRTYAFGNGRVMRDTFSGYDYQASLAGGLGYTFWKAEEGELSVEAGPGYRRSKMKNLPAEDNAIGLLKEDFSYRFSATTQFEQSLSVLSGKENTEAELQAGLRVNMTDTLAMKLSHTVQYNSDVLPGKKNTDTFTAVNLVYDFAK
ncbi:conserved exported protein of unknown function [Sterolibacterium denitrificans]|uniref:Salt-induced outer membrane protein n=2 Tax=Sterolibacterium denitrificans TaxID=157592 RepID=A0A7Z7HRN9_9PROT|nr:conserved exported protein of unknown function [Sterolibacterium denitrificans]